MAELADFGELAESAEVTTALSSASVASEAAADTLSTEIETQTAADQAEADEALAEIQTTGSATTKIPDSLQKDFQSRLDSLQKTVDELNKSLQKVDPNFKLKVGEDIQSQVNGTDTTSTANRNVFQKMFDYIGKKFGNTPKELSEKADEIDKDADRDTDSKSRAGKKSMSSFLKNAAKLGLAVGAIGAILEAMAKDQSGCYQINKTTGVSVKLACTGTVNEKNCNCTAPIDGLVAACPGVVSSDMTCVNNYAYVYRQFNIFDELSKVIATVGSIGNEAVSIVQQVVNFFKKFGIWVIVGIVLLVLIPILISLFKN